MIELKEKARKELESFFEGKEKETIRVYMSQACHGYFLTLALDNPTEDDEVVDASGFPMCIDKRLAEMVGNITIDMDAMGFNVESENPLPEAEGGCGSCCSSCHSGCGTEN